MYGNIWTLYLGFSAVVVGVFWPMNRVLYTVQKPSSGRKRGILDGAIINKQIVSRLRRKGSPPSKYGNTIPYLSSLLYDRKGATFCKFSLHWTDWYQARRFNWPTLPSNTTSIECDIKEKWELPLNPLIWNQVKIIFTALVSNGGKVNRIIT